MSIDRRPPEHAEPDPEHRVFIVYADGRQAVVLDYRTVDLRREVFDVREEYRRWLQSCCQEGIVFSD